MLNVYLPRVKIVFIIIIISIFAIFLVQFFFLSEFATYNAKKTCFQVHCLSDVIEGDLTRFSANSVFFHSGFEDGFKKLVQCVH